MTRARWPSATLIALVVAGCRADVATHTVDARCHDSFWLWPGVRPQPVLDTARQVYLLYGQVESAPVRLVAQRAATPHGADADIWMVVRAETLRWPPLIHAQLLSELSRWRASGAHVVGVQIDFDARTRHLDDYALFLAELRARLPQDTRLSITGLLDWSSQGDPQALSALGDSVDEVVLQIYQGRRIIAGHEAWLARLDRLRIPFQIGLPQGGQWTPPAGLEDNPFYRGTVVFLLNDARQSPAPNCAS